MAQTEDLDSIRFLEAGMAAGSHGVWGHGLILQLDFVTFMAALPLGEAGPVSAVGRLRASAGPSACSSRT
jgi:ATP adenylyltransferase/5',5'''-P-1,P-4-tetraphosphate phosphorylase II